jgi:NADH:ubiquinone oxidoreductase subunit 4 (subunit M)
MTGIPFLSLAIWVPIVGGLLALATGSDRNASVARFVALSSRLRDWLSAFRSTPGST